MDPAAALDHAARLAAGARGDVEPNPCVGAVILKDGDVVGEGFHAAYGGPHAEVVALRAAGARARGATLVVTLEPCSTRGKTPPCTDALLAAGVARVVVGAVDPNPDHAGRGLDLLRAAGLQVDLVEHEACAALLVPFLAELGGKRPHVMAKWAMSADGFIGAAQGEPVQLTGAEASSRVHTWRAHLDGILVGIGTVLSDDPLLTARGPVAPVRPLRRLVLDPNLRLPLTCRLCDTADEVDTWVLTREDADQQPASVLESEGVRVLRVPGGDDWLGRSLAALRVQGVSRLMVEGGARTLASFLDGGLVDQVAVFQCPVTIGAGGVPALPGRELSGDDPQALARQLGLDEVRVERLGDDTLVRGVLRA